MRFVTASIVSATRSGERIRYRFVGRLYGDKLTGEWFDARVKQDGYFGAFQVVLKPTGRVAEGRWLGFAEDGSVKADVLLMTKKSGR